MKSELGARTLFGALGGLVAGLFFACLGVVGVASRGDLMESRMLWQVPTALFGAAVLSGATGGLISGKVRGVVTRMAAGGVCGVVFGLTAATPYIGAPWSSSRDDGVAAAVWGLLLGVVLAIFIKDEQSN